jgi:hypothetical protein
MTTWSDVRKVWRGVWLELRLAGGELLIEITMAVLPQPRKERFAAAILPFLEEWVEEEKRRA